ncbi:MAG: hypothetical protein QMD50_02570 [Patescibacteria group bacterium]|nr:hypothetical protein [Patescibacteria group bacterium]
MFKKLFFTGAAVILGIVLLKNRRKFFDEGNNIGEDFSQTSERPAIFFNEG